MQHYLDHNATTPLRPEAHRAMARACNDYGNPGSTHALGRVAMRIVEGAREVVANAIGARPEEIVFTSGGTEADNLALSGAGVIAATDVEHKAVLVPASRCLAPLRIGVDVEGCIPSLGTFGERLRTALDDAIAACIAEHGGVEIVGPRGIVGCVAVAVMAANNEIGTTYPVGALARAVRVACSDSDFGGALRVHTDAVNAFGKVPLNVVALGVDTLALSAHKIGGPKGIGALYVRGGPAGAVGETLRPPCAGGGQEGGLRGGTPNVIGIAGFGAAVGASMRALRGGESDRLQVLSTRLIEGLVEKGYAVLGPSRGGAVGGGGCIGSVCVAGHGRLPNTVTVAMPSHDAARHLAADLDRRGIAVSTGSACGCKAPRRSHVLAAISREAREVAGAVRFSLGWTTSSQDVDAALRAVPRNAVTLRRRAA